MNMTFENCIIKDGCIIECLKEETIEHDIYAVFEQLEGEEGLVISIKKSTKVGAITVEGE